jgi:hypothetical protein
MLGKLLTSEPRDWDDRPIDFSYIFNNMIYRNLAWQQYVFLPGHRPSHPCPTERIKQKSWWLIVCRAGSKFGLMQ